MPPKTGSLPVRSRLCPPGPEASNESHWSVSSTQPWRWRTTNGQREPRLEQFSPTWATHYMNYLKPCDWNSDLKLIDSEQVNTLICVFCASSLLFPVICKVGIFKICVMISPHTELKAGETDSCVNWWSWLCSPLYSAKRSELEMSSIMSKYLPTHPFSGGFTCSM